MNDSLKSFLFFTLRVLCYSLVMVVLNIIFIHDASHVTSTGKFGENSWTELIQEGILFVVAILFIIIGRNNRDLTTISNLISVFFFMSFIREFNNQIEFWIYLEIPLILVFAWLVFRDRQKLLLSVHHFVTNPAVSWFVIGFLVTFIFSRMFGRSALWKSLLENDYTRWAKNAAEEGIELLGYSLFLISGIELIVQVLRKRKHSGE
jgi:hypothetical protein